MSNKRVVTLGEVMLRFKPSGFERLFQSSQMDATFGGSEANVAASLARFGMDVSFVTALPSNDIGEGCRQFLRGFGVDTSQISRQGERVGIYFLEQGASQRPSWVTYDRAGSAMAEAAVDDFDWDAIFDGVGWLHVSGITPALGLNSAELTDHALKTARAHGITTSCDINYRSKLWQYGKSAAEIMPALVHHVDVLIANETDCRLSLGLDLDLGNTVDAERCQKVAEQTFYAFPNLRYQAMTLRETISASHNRWAACLFDGTQLHQSQEYDMTHIVDRVGGGDAFAAGLIYGLFCGLAAQETLAFAVAASCLKHSIAGDVNWISADEVYQLIDTGGSGRVQR